MRANLLLAVLCLILCLAVVIPSGLAQYDPKYDHNNDGVIDALDLLEFQQHWHAMVTGDLVVNLGEGVQMEMVRIPAGSFLMGRYSGEDDSCSLEDPQHAVTLSQDFYLGKYEVTKAQWKAMMGTTPWSTIRYVIHDPHSPAVYVSWDDAQAFITALNQLGQGTFRLPSEAEWEYACRAGTTTRFYWGDDPVYAQIEYFAWYEGNARRVGEKYAHIVGQKHPNAWGLYDMSGNVWEWCQDWYGSYPSGAVTDPVGPSSGTSRVLRGGGWDAYDNYCRSAFRGWIQPGIVEKQDDHGFRLARTP